MDGSERRVLISGNHIEWPVDLAIDYSTRKLYWIDAKLKVIKHCDMDGSNVREVVNQGIIEPSGITVFEDHMYWIDQKAIKKANKFTGKNVTVLVNEAYSPLDLHIYHPQRQPAGTQNKRTFFKLSRVENAFMIISSETFCKLEVSDNILRWLGVRVCLVTLLYWSKGNTEIVLTDFLFLLQLFRLVLWTTEIVLICALFHRKRNLAVAVQMGFIFSLMAKRVMKVSWKLTLDVFGFYWLTLAIDWRTVLLLRILGGWQLHTSGRRSPIHFGFGIDYSKYCSNSFFFSL